MFTPGDRPEMMRKAPNAGTDTIVFDLEDAVAPGRKTEARDAVHELLAGESFDPDAELCVRVNPIDAGAIADLDAAFDGTEPDSLMLPKVEHASDVERLAALAADRGVNCPILALVETARGVLHADEIADAEPTDAVLFGAEDLAADLGATRTDEGTEVLYARERVVVAASAAGIDAIDTVFTAFDDPDGLAEEAAFAVELGYDGKMAIHPSQVGPINDAFTPSDEEIEWARRVLDAREEAAADDRGVFEVDGEMIDAPLIARAERIVERANAARAI